MLSFFKRHWFLLALGLVLLGGIRGSKPLAPAANSPIFQQAVVFATMLVMALPLRFDHLRAGLSRPLPAIIAIVSNLLLVPFLAWVAAKFLPQPLALGLLVTATVPTTLASAAVLARRGGGDPTVPILTTLFTNGICFLYTPFALSILLPQSGRAEMDFWKTAIQLALLIVAPMVAAQLLRVAPPIRRRVDQHAKSLGLLSQIGILVMVGISAIQMGQRWEATGGADELAWRPLSQVIAAVVTVHLVTLGLTWFASRSLKVDRPQTIGAALAGSQKTLMVGLQIAISPEINASILPMIAYHVGQLILDTMLTNRWKAGEAGEKSSH